MMDFFLGAFAVFAVAGVIVMLWPAIRKLLDRELRP